jgi:DNA-binding response OmpR family regulator
VVRIAQEQRPGLFLLDLMLPGTSGIDVAEELRADSAPETPIVAMSASSEMLRRARDSRLFTDSLAKPFDLDDLVACVEHYLHDPGP